MRPIFVRLVGDDGDAPDPLVIDLLSNLRDVEAGVQRLSTRHRNGVVEQQLVGDGGLGRDTGANRQQPRVKVSAVAEILKGVLLVGEGRFTEPGGSFPSHVCKKLDSRFRHPYGHGMATDATENTTIGRCLDSVVMRASGAEERDSDDIRVHRLGGLLLSL